jgi:hypothetical protein
MQTWSEDVRVAAQARTMRDIGLTAILVFIYLQRSGPDASSWLACTAVSSHDAYQRATGQLGPLSQRLLTRGDHVGRRESPVYQHVQCSYVVAGKD